MKEGAHQLSVLKFWVSGNFLFGVRSQGWGFGSAPGDMDYSLPDFAGYPAYNESQMLCGACVMKSATIPPLRVTPELRQAAESVLREGETLSSFVESSLVKQIESRKSQQEFIARGLASRETARKSGKYFSKEESLAALDAILDKRRGAQ